MADRKPRRCIELREKKKVLEELKAGKHVLDVAAEFGISTRQVYDIRKHKDAIDLHIKSGDIPMHSKVAKNKSKHPDIDRSVFEWFCSIRKLRRGRKPQPVSRSLIKARAMYEARRCKVLDFKASDGWFFHWRWRFGVTKQVRLHGEAGDVDIVTADQEMQKLRTELQEYQPTNVFNMDEAGLFFRAIPNRSYLMPDEGDARQVARGTKAMKAKERLTIILCVNATGNCKMAPVVIGSAKNPRCFKDTPPSLPYFHQRNAWNDTKNYNKWWQEVFLPTIRQFTHDRVALLVDGFSGHDTSCVDPLGQVKVFKFPPNITSVYQPLDQGIIAVLKAGYKNKLLSRLVETAESYPQ